MQTNSKTFTCAIFDVDTAEVSQGGRHVFFAGYEEGRNISSCALTPADARAMARHLIECATAIEKANPQEPARIGSVTPSYSGLSEQAQLVYRHMNRAGSISAREAMDDHGITSATLARRICDIESEGFLIHRERKTHPITQKRYTRYALGNA